MTFRDDGDAARARAAALQTELDETEGELAETKARLAASEAALAAEHAEDASRARVAARLEKLAERGAKESERPKRQAAPEPTKLEAFFGATTKGQVVPVMVAFLLLVGIPVILPAVIIGAFWGQWISALAIGAFVGLLAWAGHRWRPATSLKRARRKIAAERSWAASLPYRLDNWPEVMVGLGGDHLVLRLHFDGGPPPELDAMVRGCGGKEVGRGMHAFPFGTSSETQTNHDGTTRSVVRVVPRRARKTLRTIDPLLLSPLAEAHDLTAVTAYLAMGNGLEPDLIEMLHREHGVPSPS